MTQAPLLITPGARVKAIWGAMFPAHEGTIIHVSSPNTGYALIEWDEWCELPPSWHTVRATPSIGGSPIGVFLVQSATAGGAK